MTVVEIMRDLENAAKALDKASTRLAGAIREFEGDLDEHGVWQPGPQLLYMEKVSEFVDAEIAEYEAQDKRPPARETLEHRAERKIHSRHPDLFSDYHRLRSEIANLQKWVSAKKETISARQSVLSAEKALVQPMVRA